MTFSQISLKHWSQRTINLKLPTIPFRIVACAFFPTTFLETAVYIFIKLYICLHVSLYCKNNIGYCYHRIYYYSLLSSWTQISVGLVEWKRYKRKSYKPPKLISRQQVGHKMTVSVTIDKDATASCVLQKAVEAFKLMDTDMQDQHFRLLYPDLKWSKCFTRFRRTLFSSKVCGVVGNIFQQSETVHRYRFWLDGWVVNNPWLHLRVFFFLRWKQLSVVNKYSVEPAPLVRTRTGL